MSKTYVFYVRGMTCTSCSGMIESYLKSIYSERLEQFSVDVTVPDPKKTVITLADSETDNDAQEVWKQLKEHIEDIGYNCEPYEYLPFADQDQSEPVEEPEQPTNIIQKITAWGEKILSSHWFLGALGCSTGIALLIATLVSGGLPLVAMIPLAGLSVLLTTALGARSYYEAWKKLTVSRGVTMDTLFAISTLTVIGVSIASFFVPWLPMMFEVGLLIYGFRHIGIAIENTIKEKISSAQFQDRAPKIVKLSTKNGITETPLYQIKPDDVIIISPGEIIPVDGICIEESMIYDTIITGAILPRHFRPGDKVLAGMRLAIDAQPLKIHVTKTAKESYLARLDAGIAQSINEKAPLEIKTERILTYFVPTVIALSVISGVIIGTFFTPALAIQCAISVLVSACPCTLGLIIPLAVKTGIHKAAENGVRFKNSKILQQAEQIDTVVFDLNGTLTQGIPKVKHFSVLAGAGLSENQLLDLCYTLEEKSAHPIGKAIYSYANKNIPHQFIATHLNDSHHAGIEGTINNEHYTIGSLTLMREKGILTGEVEKYPDLEAGDSMVFIAKGNTLIGYIIITDPLRKDALQTVNALMAMGKDVHLCTGADEKTANRYAKALGIKKVHAGCVATTMEQGDKSKTAYIKSLQNKGHKVAMVGDAANDTQAIAASDFGIAVLSTDSDELTEQQAGAIIQSGTLLPIVSAFTISKQTVSNIKQNLILSFSYNLVSVLLAGGLLVSIGFSLPPAIGVIIMAIQACSILLNVYHFKHQPLEHLQDETSKQEETPYSESSSTNIINRNMPQNNAAPKHASTTAPPPKENLSEYKSTTSFWNNCSPEPGKRHPENNEDSPENGTQPETRDPSPC